MPLRRCYCNSVGLKCMFLDVVSANLRLFIELLCAQLGVACWLELSGRTCVLLAHDKMKRMCPCLSCTSRMSDIPCVVPYLGRTSCRCLSKECCRPLSHFDFPIILCSGVCCSSACSPNNILLLKIRSITRGRFCF